MLLSMVKCYPENVPELITSCQNNIESAIQENRKIAQGLVMPDFEAIPLLDQLHNLMDNMLTKSGVYVIIDTKHIQEEWLEDEQKLVIYRIAQEQCTNIVKHAQAGFAYMLLSTVGGVFKMIIFDNGKGADTGSKTDGIGLKNIRGRLSIFNGTASIRTNAGKGFELEIVIPLTNNG
jgi:signal transduction histidine kinase